VGGLWGWKRGGGERGGNVIVRNANTVGHESIKGELPDGRVVREEGACNQSADPIETHYCGVGGALQGEGSNEAPHLLNQVGLELVLQRLEARHVVGPGLVEIGVVVGVVDNQVKEMQRSPPHELHGIVVQRVLRDPALITIIHTQPSLNVREAVERDERRQLSVNHAQHAKGDVLAV